MPAWWKRILHYSSEFSKKPISPIDTFKNSSMWNYHEPESIVLFQIITAILCLFELQTHNCVMNNILKGKYLGVFLAMLLTLANMKLIQ